MIQWLCVDFLAGYANAKKRTRTKKNVLNLGLKISFITYISGSYGGLRKKKTISLLKPTFKCWFLLDSRIF